ncbi:MAG: hypothetical protein JO157_05920 [Acetobacteraceae bacterium]|nr:hypothetical protein [Acetobacteraceae bacterium]
MKKEFIVERQGRSFVLYAGLLDLAHSQGLASIRTELIQAPSEANNRVAICAAVVTMERDGLVRTFTGLGDAAPNNVTPAMQTCLLRMAETRAKARALRDATNIGEAAFEELDEEDAKPVRAARPRPQEAPKPRSSEVSPAIKAALASDPAELASESQLAAIQTLCRKRGTSAADYLRDRYGVTPETLTQALAPEVIKGLNPTSGRTA